MLSLLHIENIAVIEKADIEFGEGLNVLTGETGAGKSIVIDSLGVISGERISRDIIRTGSGAASVTAVFTDICESTWLEENGIEQDESGELMIFRRISADGRNTCRINGMPVAVAQLHELGEKLVNIYGQNDGKLLLRESSHREYLDSYGALSDMLSAYKEQYDKFQALLDEYDEVLAAVNDREYREEMLRHQITELEKAELRVGEDEELQERHGFLKNAEKLTHIVESAFSAFYGGDDFEGVCSLLMQAQLDLDSAARYTDKFGSISDEIVQMRYTAEDIEEKLRELRGELDFSPEEFDRIEARLNTINRLKKRYGSIDDCIVALDKMRSELDSLEYSSDRLSKLEKELNEQKKVTEDKARSLSAMRRKAAESLSNEIVRELSDLSMPGVRFSVDFLPKMCQYGFDSTGCDEVRFLMSANAGEGLGRISKIASGGELSRIMLALKKVLVGCDDVEVLVFDEVDSGVSGIAAQRVGEKLSDIAADKQVLCVTHLPQLAAMADCQFEIKKVQKDGRTFTEVDRLDIEGRKRELARLTGGENITETTLKSAEEQLAAAKKYKERLKSR